VALELGRAHEAGVRAIRTNVQWREVEPSNVSPDAFNWEATDSRLRQYASAGYEVVLTVVAYPKWAMVYQCGYGYNDGMEAEWRQFVRALASRYSDPKFGVTTYEIGNEIDGTTRVDAVDHDRPPGWAPGEPTLPVGGCWGDRPAEYVGFLRAAYEEIGAAHPSARVMAGSLAFTWVDDGFHKDFLDGMLAAGGGRYTDVVGYHWFPDLKTFFPEEPTGPEKYRQVRDVMASHGLNVPVWLTETYQLTQEGDPSSEVPQVRFLTKELVDLLAVSDLQRVFWYSWVDYPGQEPGYRQRGLVRSDRQPKPGLGALPYAVKYTNGVPENLSSERVIAYGFRPQDGQAAYIVAWSRDGAAAELAIPSGNFSTAEVTVVSSAELAAATCCSSETVAAELDRFSFPVGADTVFIRLGEAR
jgi:hypothetical protein